MKKTAKKDVRVCSNGAQLKVDVVIPTIGETSLSLCLQAIEKSMRVNRIILVGPEDLRSRFKDWKKIMIVVSNSKNVGKKRDLGLEYVTTKYYASIDSDVIVNKRWFDWCMQTIVKERVAACEGYGKGSQRNVRILMEDFKNGKDWVGLGNTLLRTDVIRKVGMPEKKYAEDHELVRRIRSIGYKWILNLNISCQHLVSDVGYWKHRAKWGEIAGIEAFELTQWLRTVAWTHSKCLLRNKLSDCLFFCISEYFCLYGYLKGVIKRKLNISNV